MNNEMKERMERQYREALKKNIRITKKQNKKEKVLSVLIIGFIVVATSLLLTTNYRMTKKAVDSCQAKGNNYNYCVNKLG